MRANRILLDTNVIIQHGMIQVPGTRILSAVVLQELASGASDSATVRQFGWMRKEAEADGILLVPNGEDWYEAGKVLNALLRGLPSRKPGRKVSIDKQEQQRLVRDVLIARSAKRANAAVATYNRGDFEKIQRFCAVRIMEPADLLHAAN